MEGSPIARGRGRLRKITGETIRRNLKVNALNINKSPKYKYDSS